MYISYSGYKTYKSCPRQYWHGYVAKTESPEPDSMVNSLYGSVVGNIMEDFYTKSLWREKNVHKSMEDRIQPTYQRVVDQERKRGRVLKWWSPEDKRQNYKNEDELLVDVRDTIARAIRIVREYRFVGPKMEAEAKLDSDTKGHRLGGRADFIIQRTTPHKDLIILDGKGSKHRDKYIDPTQLRWYAMLYQMKYKTLPDKLGFVYWRFDPPASVDWVEFTDVDIEDLYETVIDTVNEIEKGATRRPGAGIETTRRAFPPRPEEFNCKFCSFLSLCPEGQEGLRQAELQKKQRK